MSSYKLLLDANLSPRIGKALAAQFGVDVTSLQGQRLGMLRDNVILEMARAQSRVIITLDEDFVGLFESSSPTRRVGTIYLDLPNRLRYTPSFVAALSAFFRNEARSIDLNRSLVTITEHQVIVHSGLS